MKTLKEEKFSKDYKLFLNEQGTEAALRAMTATQTGTQTPEPEPEEEKPAEKEKTKLKTPPGTIVKKKKGGVPSYKNWDEWEAQSKGAQHPKVKVGGKMFVLPPEGGSYVPGPAPTKKKNKGGGAKRQGGRSMGRKLWKAMTDKAKAQGKTWSQLPYNDPARVAYRDWRAGKKVAAVTDEPAQPEGQPVNPEYRTDPKTGKTYKTGKTGAAAFKDRYMQQQYKPQIDRIVSALNSDKFSDRQKQQLRKDLKRIAADPNHKKHLLAKATLSSMGEDVPGAQAAKTGEQPKKAKKSMTRQAAIDRSLERIRNKDQGFIKRVVDAANNPNHRRHKLAREIIAAYRAQR